MNTTILQILRILAIVMFCAGLWNCYITRLLWKKKHCSSTLARLEDVKSRKNVRARKGGVYGPMVTFPHDSTGTYLYTVNGRDYRLKGWQHVAPGQLPKQPRVVYLTRFPRHAYLDCELMHLPEILRAFMWLLAGFSLWVLADASAAGMIIW